MIVVAIVIVTIVVVEVTEKEQEKIKRGTIHVKADWECGQVNDEDRKGRELQLSSLETDKNRNYFLR